MSYTKRCLGEAGEKLVRQYLVQENYKILEQNFQTRFGEIDIIAQQGGRFIFIEVKTRTSRIWGRPEEAVDFFKSQRLIKTAEIYLQGQNLVDVDWQIDVIAVEMNTLTKRAEIRHFKNAVV